MANRLGGGFGRGVRRGEDDAAQDDIADSQLNDLGIAGGQNLFGFSPMAMWSAPPTLGRVSTSAPSDAMAIFAALAEMPWRLVNMWCCCAAKRGLSCEACDVGI